jgi:hypothetical protein
MKQLKVFLLGFLFFAVGVLVGLGLENNVIEPSLQESNSNQETYEEILEPKVSAMIDTGEDLLGFLDIDITEAGTVWAVLEKLSNQEESLTVSSIDFGDIGMMINDINGFKNGNDNVYWQFWVNNEYADISADNYALKDGDVILWKFTSSRFELIEADTRG